VNAPRSTRSLATACALAEWESAFRDWCAAMRRETDAVREFRRESATATRAHDEVERARRRFADAWNRLQTAATDEARGQ
jgi:hypothetical protein